LLHLLPPEEQKETYAKFISDSGRAAAEIGYWFIDPSGASIVDASKVTCPVLAIAGAEDRVTPSSIVRQVAVKYKDVSTYKEFERHAHWIHSEPGWQDVALYVDAWIRQALAEGV
jgi:pimeloyl-ACP methyl ester carboxylesterase